MLLELWLGNIAPSLLQHNIHSQYNAVVASLGIDREVIFSQPQLRLCLQLLNFPRNASAFVGYLTTAVAVVTNLSRFINIYEEIVYHSLY